MASTGPVQLVSAESRHSRRGFRESIESPRALVCWFEFCFKTWQSISVLALCDSTGSWSPLHINSAGNDISTKADGGKKCPDRHILINHAAPLQAVGGLNLNPSLCEAHIERQQTKKILLARHSSNILPSREALGCRSPALLHPGCLEVGRSWIGCYEAASHPEHLKVLGNVQ